MPVQIIDGVIGGADEGNVGLAEIVSKDAYEGTRCMKLSCENDTSEWQGCAVEIFSYGRWHMSSLLSDLIVSLAYKVKLDDPQNSRFIIEFPLSERPPEYVRASLRLVAGNPEGLADNPHTLAVPLETTGEWQKTDFDMTALATSDAARIADIGGVDGLIHISELSWSKIKHPSEVVNVGDEVEVYIISFDKEKGKISLGFKKAEDNPWKKVENELKVDDVVDCKIVRIVPFGAFAEIYPGVDALIHISQVANKRIAKVEDELTIGQHVQAKVVEINLADQKIGLSIRALLEPEAPAEEAPVAEEAPAAEEATETTEE